MKRSQFESMVRKVVKEELPQLNKGSQPPMANAKVKSKKLENVRYIAQSFKTLKQRLTELEDVNDEGTAAETIQDILKLVATAHSKFLKDYASLYK